MAGSLATALPGPATPLLTWVPLHTPPCQVLEGGLEPAQPACPSLSHRAMEARMGRGLGAAPDGVAMGGLAGGLMGGALGPL